MRSGDLDRVVTIQRAVEAVGAARGANVTFDNQLVGLKADVRPISGREFMAADQERSEATTRVRLNWRTGITTKHRVAYDGKFYGVVHVAEIGHREGLELLCVEVEP